MNVVYTVLGCVGVALALYSVIRTALSGRVGADLLALLAVIGALVGGESLAAALIAIMLASGMALERHAAARAGRELSALRDRQPRYAHRRIGTAVDVVALDEIEPGDTLVVPTAEVVGVDGRLLSDEASLDESALSGEPLPTTVATGDLVRSGVVNAGAPFEMSATARTEDSTYAGILQLVAGADATSAPLVRLADRAALAFLPAALALAGASWAWSGNFSRAVAVLVVATPCPLILAVPVAISSGLSAAARRGAVVKGGAILERLSTATVVLLDKTGTVTIGKPTVVRVLAVAGTGEDEVLRLAASLDQLSSHVIADGIVRAATERHLVLGSTTDVEEVAGSGTTGFVDGRPIRIGRALWLDADSTDDLMREAQRQAELHDATTVMVEADGQTIGAILLSDQIRPDAARTLRRLRSLGIERLVMVTGDRDEPARVVGALIGVDEVIAKCSPEDKVAAIEKASRSGVTVMVGDGINDAPALAAADVGVAMGARGGSAATETADVVLGLNRLDRLGDVVAIAQRSQRLARQSVAIGMGLSIVAMAVAALGKLPATWGALLQEAIDVAVILNALRAIRGPADSPVLLGADATLARRFSDEHAAQQSHLDELLRLADRLDVDPDPLAVARQALTLLRDDLEPHELAEEGELYPVLGNRLAGPDPMMTMSREHIEISRLINRLETTIDGVSAGSAGLERTDVAEIRRLLYGLHAIVQLHMAQEEEGFLSLAEPAEPAERAERVAS